MFAAKVDRSCLIAPLLNSITHLLKLFCTKLPALAPLWKGGGGQCKAHFLSLTHIKPASHKWFPSLAFSLSLSLVLLFEAIYFLISLLFKFIAYLHSFCLFFLLLFHYSYLIHLSSFFLFKSLFFCFFYLWLFPLS